MPSPSDPVHLSRLRQRIALSVAIEEATVEALSHNLRETRHELNAEQARALEQAIRTHRVGLIKLRALMGALGIDV